MIFIEPNSVGHDNLSEFPDLFVDKSERESKTYIKNINDYFTAEARRQYHKNLKIFVKNYAFMKGKLTREDFYDRSKEEQKFMEDLGYDPDNDGLPEDVVHYSILNQPINTLIGELSSKPDNFFVKAFDEMSQSEQLQYMNSLIEQLLYTKVRDNWIRKFAEQGADINSEEFMQNVQQVTDKEVAEKLSSYSSLAERWANRMLEALKMQFNTKEMSEDAFSDLLITGRERYHIYEDNSSTGFGVENVNPKNVFRINHPDHKYTKDDYVTGIIEVLDISEIMSKFKLNKKDIDNLRDIRKKTSSSLTSSGVNSITFEPTYDPWLEKVRELEEFSIFDREIDDYHRVINGQSKWYGTKYLCVTTYVRAKIKIGKLTYINSDGIETVDFVDEEYKKGTHPGELELEWAYYDKWYKAVNIGGLLYSYEPVNFLDRNPIVGGDFDPRNSEVKGLLDLAKPFQIIYTIAVNQLYRLMQKEIGVVYNVSLRKIPLPEDGDHRDALDDWEDYAREKGIVFEDDSPENMGTPGGNQSASKAVDLTRTQEIQSRYTIAQQMKMECWELLGITRERLGGVAASQTAQGAQISLSQSYAQTAPWFTHHYYILNDLYQTMLEAAQYYESQKEESTLSYISGTAENVFIRVAGTDLKGRELRVFVTDRAEDYEELQRMRAFTNEMLQNGVSAYDVSQVMSNKSIRMAQDVLRKVKERNEEFQQQSQDIERQKAEAIDRQTQTLQQVEQARLENENLNKALDRESKERIAAINTYSRQDSNTIDANGNGTPDIMDLLSSTQESDRINRDFDLKTQMQQSKERVDVAKLASQNRKLFLEQQQHQDKMKQLEEDRKLREKQINANVTIAKTNKN